jgi:hypothetical protein
MEEDLEQRKALAQALRTMWSTHTLQSEPDREAFFNFLDTVAETGQLRGQIHVTGDYLPIVRVSESESPSEPSPIVVGFALASNKDEFMQTLQGLLPESPKPASG